MVIERTKCAEKIVAVQGGKEGLDYLTEQVDGYYPQPNIIFFDINMPGMDGWEFLEEYDKLSEEQKEGVVEVTLTASLNSEDAKKAETLKVVDGFKSKPLTSEMIHDVIEQHFPDHL